MDDDLSSKSDSFDASLESNSDLEDDSSRDWDAWSNGFLDSTRASSRPSTVGNEVKSTTRKIILFNNHYGQILDPDLKNSGEDFDAALLVRMKEVETQIDNLIKESVLLLKAQLKETNPTEFCERAQRILCSSNALEKARVELETEIRWLEEKDEQLMDEWTEVLPVTKSEEEVDLAELPTEIKSIIRRPPFKTN